MVYKPVRYTTDRYLSSRGHVLTPLKVLAYLEIKPGSYAEIQHHKP
jgi:hypothetical protein